MAASVADNMALSYITTLTVREKTYEHWLLGSLHLSPIANKFPNCLCHYLKRVICCRFFNGNV